ncbi:MAG: ATP-binding cassette domain-containing protein [Planctomycetota bacterium]|nr:MAG: ATP-binding cassette domain-containing protein [Planctomycetota bacterium]
MTHALQTRGLGVVRGSRRLIEDVDLALETGAYALLCGPSGSGKTTLLRAIAGLVEPSAGRIEIDGRVVSDGPRLLVPPHRRGIGFVFQGGALWPHLDCLAQLEFALSAQNAAKGERRERAQRMLELVELDAHAHSAPHTLSGGEAQRLALARALVGRPRLLLLDEPLGPLDARLRGALAERLARLHRELGFTALHVTHDPDEVRGLATHRFTLDQGRLCADEPLRRNTA